MKRFLMVTAASALLCSPVLAQQAAVMPTPSLSATTPLGMVPTAPVGGTGIPLGSTEIASPGVSPVPISPPVAGGSVCTTIGTAPSTMFGSVGSFDGGGVAVAAATPQGPMSTAGTMAMPQSTTASGLAPTSALIDTSGMSGMCGSGATNPVMSSAPTAPTTPGGLPRTGIPLGSTEIANLGVSSAAAVPTMGVLPSVNNVAPTVPSIPALTIPAPAAAAVPPPVDAATLPPNSQ